MLINEIEIIIIIFHHVNYNDKLYCLLYILLDRTRSGIENLDPKKTLERHLHIFLNIFKL